MPKDFWKDMGVLDENFDGEVDIEDAIISDDFDSEMERSNNFSDDEIDDEDSFNEDEDYYDNSEVQSENDCADDKSPTITLSFSLAESERTKPITGAWKYYDESFESWDFAQALIDKFPELANDYEANSDGTLPTIISDAYEEDKPKCIKYLKWLWAFFHPSLFLDEKDSPWHRPSYIGRGKLIYHLIVENDNDDHLYQLLKTDSDFINATCKDCVYDKHDYSLIERYMELMFSHNDCESALRIYNEYLAGQVGRYSQRDLGKMWLSLVKSIQWDDKINESDKISMYNEILPVLDTIVLYGKKAIAEIDKYKKNWQEEQEEKRREQVEESAYLIDMEEQRKQEEAERIEEEKKEKALAPIVAQVSQIIHDLIFNGEYCNDDSLPDKKFEICFFASKHSYDILCEKILSNYGAVASIGNGLLKGIISTNNIKEMYMLLSTTHALSNYLHCNYGSRTPSEAALTASEVNAPIVNYIIEHNRFAKLLELENKAFSLGVWYFQNPILKSSHEIWRESEISEREKAKKLYADYLATGEIKSKWVSEQKMFMLIKHCFPDAVFQYAPEWLDSQSLDVFIPSLMVGFEYQGVQHYQSVKIMGQESDLAKQQERDAKKKEKCDKSGVALIEWRFDEPLEDEILQDKIKPFLTD